MRAGCDSRKEGEEQKVRSGKRGFNKSPIDKRVCKKSLNEKLIAQKACWHSSGALFRGLMHSASKV